MTPIISPWTIYAIHLLGCFHQICAMVVIICLTSGAISGFFLMMTDDELVMPLPKLRSCFKTSMAVMAVALVGAAIVPSEKVLVKMMIANQVTWERVERVSNEIIAFSGRDKDK